MGWYSETDKLKFNVHEFNGLSLNLPLYKVNI